MSSETQKRPQPVISVERKPRPQHRLLSKESKRNADRRLKPLLSER